MDKWTINKINTAVNETRENGIIYFNFSINSLTELEKLNECLFKKRPDLILRFVTENNNDFTSLYSLKNIKKLSLFGYDSLNEIKNINHLIFLEIYNVNKKTLDINFLEKLNNLHELRLTGKIKGIEPIGKCINLEHLYISTTIKNYDFIEPLNKLTKITIDHCISINDFSLLNKPKLEEIKILSINGMENIDSIKNFKFTRKLQLDASRVKLLPKMGELNNLKELELRNFKIWENPDVLKTIPKLEKIKLEEINTKLKAEQFYFLTRMETLKEIDFEFIDYNKTRIEKLNKWFKENGKGNIVKNNGVRQNGT
jgi:hypothetical protein